MNSFIRNIFVVLSIALPVFGYSADNYTCGVEGFCSESVIIESQHQGIVCNKFWTLKRTLGALGSPLDLLTMLQKISKCEVKA